MVELIVGWWNERLYRSTALVSRGTVSFRTPGCTRAIVTGLSTRAHGRGGGRGEHDQEPPPIPRPTQHVYTESALPIPALLGQCRLFVTRGGFNSVKEAVSAGAPMLVLPIASDQF